MPYRHTPVTEIDLVNKLFIYHFTLSVEPHSVYAISFFWYGILGFFITYIIGYFASLIFSEYLRSITLVCATQWNLDIRTSLALLYNYRGSTVLLILNNIVSPAQSEVIMKSQVFSGCLTFNLSPNWTHLQSGKADAFPAVTSDDQKYVCLHKLHSPRQ